jgi:hypothetical protein
MVVLTVLLLSLAAYSLNTCVNEATYLQDNGG